MVRHTQQFVWNLRTNCLSVFDHFVGLALKGLIIDLLLFANDISNTNETLAYLILNPS